MAQDRCIHCPYCDTHLCMRSDLDNLETGVPPPGSIAFCGRCEKIAVVGDDGDHLRPTQAQLDEMRSDTELCRSIAEMVMQTRLLQSLQSDMPPDVAATARRPTMH